MIFRSYNVALVICMIDLISSATDHLPENLSKELFCAGCEATVKALDDILKVKNSDAYDFRVLEALSLICDKKTFSSSDYSPYYMEIACNHMIENHEVLEPFLVSHYSRIKRISYQELLQQVCESITSACLKINRKKMEKLKRIHIREDGGVSLNEEWKKTQPIQESRDEF